jgi:nucleoside-diphosphate-sugar epimerase
MNKFNVLITGACGMVGSHLIEHFDSEDAECKVIGSYYNPTVDLTEIKSTAELVECDVRYPNFLSSLIGNGLPEKIFHLAAQSYPVVSWGRPAETLDTNCIGTINVFEAVKQARIKHPSYDPIVVVACSSAQYGASMQGEPVHEDTLFLPLHPYGVSKVTQDLLAYQYFMSDNIRSIRARIFNTTGPRKKNDVISDFAYRLARIAGGKEHTLRVGNIKTKRAILDVSDLIEALVLLSDKGQAGEAYNICSDSVYLIEDILDLMVKTLDMPINYEVDPALLRKTDEPIILGNNQKLKKATNWQPKVPIEQTVKRVLDYYKDKV